MKKYLFLSCFAFGLTAFSFPGSFYDLPVTTISNGMLNLYRFHGKRIMIVILPLSGGDSTSITPGQIAGLAAGQKDSLIIIGVPGVEMGYTDALKGQVQTLYANMPANFILTSGMKTSRSSGQSQAPFFQWLTDIKKNGFFDKDAKETGEKFFVNKYGHLYAVMGSQVKLSTPIIDRVLSEHGH